MTLRSAGVGFPNGPVSNDAVFALPSPDLLMLSTEGRWHYDDAVRAGKRCLWRAIPRIGKRPAELGWSPSRFVGETINLTDAPTLPITDFVWANELDLQTERGDLEDDWSNLEQRYSLIGGWAHSVVTSLKQWSPSTRIHWPAWTPDHHALDHVTRWLEAARLCDVIDFHAYDSLENIKAAYHAYRNEFSDKPLALTEWHCRGDLAEERRVLAWLSETMAADPLFEAAYFFIWRWHDAPGWWDDRWDVEHNPERLALFTDPPVAVPAPHPEPEAPVYRVPAWTPSYEQIRDGALQVADERGLPRRRLLGLCLAESGFGLQSFDRWASIERSKRMKAAIAATDWRLVERIFDEIKGTPTNDISFGPCHQSWWWSLTAEQQREHPDWRHNLGLIMDFRAWLIEDHGGALRLAAGKIDGRGDDLNALCLYNKPSVPPAQNPNRPNYQRSLAEADRILAELAPQQPQEPAMTVYEPFPDPGDTGSLTRCEGVIFHGSRSGRAGNPLESEYLGTARYEQNNPLGLGWNATVGPGKVAIHFPVDRWGHNARAASSRYVAVEIAQPTVNDPLPDSVPTALADYIYDHVWPVWGEVWHFPSHAELELWGETGQKDGKSDLYPAGDERMNVFREKVYDRLRYRQSVVHPEPEPAPSADLATLVGVAYAEDGVVIPALTGARAAGDWSQVDAVIDFLRKNDPHRAA